MDQVLLYPMDPDIDQILLYLTDWDMEQILLRLWIKVCFQFDLMWISSQLYCILNDQGMAQVLRWSDASRYRSGSTDVSEIWTHFCDIGWIEIWIKFRLMLISSQFWRIWWINIWNKFSCIWWIKHWSSSTISDEWRCGSTSIESDMDFLTVIFV